MELQRATVREKALKRPSSKNTPGRVAFECVSKIKLDPSLIFSYLKELNEQLLYHLKS